MKYSVQGHTYDVSNWKMTSNSGVYALSHDSYMYAIMIHLKPSNYYVIDFCIPVLNKLHYMLYNSVIFDLKHNTLEEAKDYVNCFLRRASKLKAFI